MGWNNDFDIGAILIIGLLVLYYLVRQNIPIKRNKIFLNMMINVQVFALFDILGSASINWNIPLIFKFTFNILYYACLGLDTFLFGYFCYALTDKYREHDSSLLQKIYFVPLIIYELCVFTTPFTGLIFDIDNEGFTYGPGRIIVFINIVLYLTIGEGIIGKWGRRFRRMYRYAIAGYSICLIIGNIMQMFFMPYITMVAISETVGILTLYLSFETPENFIDKKVFLYNDEGYNEILFEYIRSGKRFKLVEMGIHNFSAMENVYGIDIRERALFEVGKYFRNKYPKHLIFYDDGRFYMFFNPDEDMKTIYKEACERFNETFHTPALGVKISPYFAYLPEGYYFNDEKSLRTTMDNALYKAKDGEDMSVVIINDEIIADGKRDKKITTALERALDNNELKIFYQPIYDTKEKRITCAEALVRIDDPELGLIFPDDFIWRAERNGSILELGQQVFEKTCEFIKNYDIGKYGIHYIEVNLSPIQCMRAQLADEFEQIVKKAGISPSMINLEVTETASSSNMLKNNMLKLYTFGINFSLDDYGTGYSNLVNILKLPISIVKIDKSITWDYFQKGNTLLANVVKMFLERKMDIVVEGVETEEMARKLSEMGVHYEQGYYFSKPVPEDIFVKYLEDHMEEGSYNI